MDFGIQSISFDVKLTSGGLPSPPPTPFPSPFSPTEPFPSSSNPSTAGASTVKSSTLNPRALSKSERLIISTLHLEPKPLLATTVSPFSVGEI